MNIPLLILGRAFRLILAEPLNTLRVIAPGSALIAVAAYIVLHGFGFDLVAVDSEQAVASPGLIALGLLVSLLGWMTFAVFWHRHALLQEAARQDVMRANSRIYWQYFKGLMIIFILLVLAGLGLGLVVGFVGALFSAASTGIRGFALFGATLAVNMALSWILLRNSLVLPAAATGAHLTVSESWRATARLSRDIFWTAVLLGVISAVLQQLATGVAIALPGFAFWLSVLQVILQSLIFISVLSTLYGHLIQNRPLA